MIPASLVKITHRRSSPYQKILIIFLLKNFTSKCYS